MITLIFNIFVYWIILSVTNEPFNASALVGVLLAVLMVSNYGSGYYDFHRKEMQARKEDAKE